MLDIRITGGLVVDGTGESPRPADVGVSGDTITAMGDLSQMEARLTIDLAGSAVGGASLVRKVVCPGFIDAHSHSDTKILIEPSATSKIYQGVTTEIVGNCGSSAAPIAGPIKPPWEKDEGEGLPGKWHSVAEYRRLLETVKPAANVAMLIGHGTLRAGVVGYEDRSATADELKAMALALERALDEGGRGLSSGLIYSPGMFADASELIELARIAGRRGGVYATHMRSEGSGLLDSLRETLDLGRRAEVRVEISHLKTRGRENWSLLDPALELIRKQREDGIVVQADRYPYVAANTGLDTVLPMWVHDGGNDAALARLRDKTVRERMAEELRRKRPTDYWGTITVASTAHPDTIHFQGMPLVEIAKRLALDPVDTVLHLLDLDELKTTAFFFGMSEENMLRILAEPWVAIGSDASLRAPTGLLSRDFPHPRSYGTFTRFLRMSLDGRTVPLPEAVRKMTSLPAEHFGIRDRGRITVGMKADIVVFDPATVCDRATYARPHQLSEGIECVIVNGVVTLRNGKLTGDRAGRFL